MPRSRTVWARSSAGNLDWLGIGHLPCGAQDSVSTESRGPDPARQVGRPVGYRPGLPRGRQAPRQDDHSQGVWRHERPPRRVRREFGAEQGRIPASTGSEGLTAQTAVTSGQVYDALSTQSQVGRLVSIGRPSRSRSRRVKHAAKFSVR